MREGAAEERVREGERLCTCIHACKCTYRTHTVHIPYEPRSASDACSTATPSVDSAAEETTSWSSRMEVEANRSARPSCDTCGPPRSAATPAKHQQGMSSLEACGAYTHIE